MTSQIRELRINLEFGLEPRSTGRSRFAMQIEGTRSRTFIEVSLDILSLRDLAVML